MFASLERFFEGTEALHGTRETVGLEAGQVVDVRLADAGELEPEFHPHIRSLVTEFARSDATEELRIGLVSRTSRDGGPPRRAVSFACPDCGATFQTLDLRRRADRLVALPVGCPESVELEWPHWCYSEGGVPVD
jgi:predicted RNA-binding Zn-ribbon protein involved in translation (DUF1610 family)